MTKGTVVFVDSMGMYQSIEYVGNMSLFEHGAGVDIVKAFQKGLLSNRDDFVRFLDKFNQTHFGYAENRPVYITQDISYQSVDTYNREHGDHRKLTNLYDLRTWYYNGTVPHLSDYTYFINYSGLPIIVQTESTDVAVANEMLTIFSCASYFNSFVRTSQGEESAGFEFQSNRSQLREDLSMYDRLPVISFDELSRHLNEKDYLSNYEGLCRVLCDGSSNLIVMSVDKYKALYDEWMRRHVVCDRRF